MCPVKKCYPFMRGIYKDYRIIEITPDGMRDLKKYQIKEIIEEVKK